MADFAISYQALDHACLSRAYFLTQTLSCVPRCQSGLDSFTVFSLAMHHKMLSLCIRVYKVSNRISAFSMVPGTPVQMYGESMFRCLKAGSQ